MDKLDNREFVSKLDVSDMLRLISGLPAQCQDAYDIGNRADISKIEREISNIVFAGLGGSAIGADIVRIYLQNEIKVSIVVCRNYTLPAFVGEGTFLFCSSYSGNTEETLGSYDDGLKKNASITTMGSGGELKERSIKDGFNHILIPSGFPPRTAVGYMSVTVLALLSRMGFILDKKEEIESLCSTLEDLRDKEIGIDVPLNKNIAKQIASKLHSKYCIVYGTSDSTDAVSIRWRGQIAENSKSLSSSHVFPEMNHNEIVGWEFPKALLKDFKVIILRDSKDDHDRTKKRIEISKTIIKRAGAEIVELEGRGRGLLERIFSLIYIGDFVSFYLAILNGVDPTPVKQVDYLKRELAKV